MTATDLQVQMPMVVPYPERWQVLLHQLRYYHDERDKFLIRLRSHPDDAIPAHLARALELIHQGVATLQHDLAHTRKDLVLILDRVVISSAQEYARLQGPASGLLSNSGPHHITPETTFNLSSLPAPSNDRSFVVGEPLSSGAEGHYVLHLLSRGKRSGLRRIGIRPGSYDVHANEWGLARHPTSGHFVVLRGGPSATEPVEGCELVSHTHNAAPDAFLKNPAAQGIELRSHLEIFAMLPLTSDSHHEIFRLFPSGADVQVHYNKHKKHGVELIHTPYRIGPDGTLFNPDRHDLPTILIEMRNVRWNPQGTLDEQNYMYADLTFFNSRTRAVIVKGELKMAIKGQAMWFRLG